MQTGLMIVLALLFMLNAFIYSDCCIRKVRVSLLHPLVSFNAGWLLPFVLYLVRLLPYYGVYAKTFIFVMASSVAFSIGALWGPAVLTRRQPPEARHILLEPGAAQYISGQMLDCRAAARCLAVLNVLSTIGFALSLVRLHTLLGGWPSLSALASTKAALAGVAAREAVGAGIAGYLSSATYIAAVIGGMLHGDTGRYAIASLYCLCVTAASALATGTRASFLHTAILFCSSFILTAFLGARRLKLSKYVLILAVCSAVVFVFDYIGYARFHLSDNASYSSLSPLPPWLLHPYTYVTSGFGGLNVHLADPEHLDLPGVHTFPYLFRAVSRLAPSILPYDYDYLVEYSVTRRFVETPIRTNIYTYLGYLYDDVGVVGALVLNIVFGLISVKLLYAIIRRRLPLHIALYSFCLLQFVYAGSSLVFRVNAIVVAIVGCVIVCPRIGSKPHETPASLLPASDALGVCEQQIRRVQSDPSSH